jgi:hypothetical protein
VVHAIEDPGGLFGKTVAGLCWEPSGVASYRPPVALPLAVDLSMIVAASTPLPPALPTMEDVCFECGNPAENYHHVVPKTKGGRKTVPLCLECHSKVHGRQMAHPALTQFGLQKAKSRGVLLGAARPGAPRLTTEARKVGTQRGAASRKRQAVDAYHDLTPIMREMRGSGATLQQIADRLNSEGYTTCKRAKWAPTQVMRALDRLKETHSSR